MTKTVLHIDASARRDHSASRVLSARVVAQMTPGRVIRRDLAEPLPHISADWIAAAFTPATDRDPVQRDLLALSDRLIDELKTADVVVIGLPIYNFSVPAALKAWIDLVARVGLTFRYTDEGPQGLLTGKRAVLAVTSGGTQIGSGIDFATPYMRHALGFIGIDRVEIVAADRLAIDPEAAHLAADDAIAALAA